MFVASWQSFTGQRPPVRSLIFLIWIYSFTSSLIGVFTQIYLYQKFTNLSLNIIAQLMLYTGIMIGFCVPGYLASIFHLNIKRGFLISFVILAASLLYLPHISDVPTAYLAMFFLGTGQGMYWLTVNTFELSETKDGERDLYASFLNAGNQILGLLGPACAVLLIWLSESIFHFGTFALLFTVAPVTYLLGFFCFAGIRDYHPSSIEWADVKYFFTDRKNQFAQFYSLGTGFQQTLAVTIPPLVLLVILGTALRVGIYDTLFAVFSSVCIIFISRYRTPTNRLLIYGLTTAGVALITIWYGYAFSLAALILYTLIEGVLSPLMNVSSHVIDLYAMEIGRKETDFYPTMLLRDFFLWIWRVVGGLIFLFVIGYTGTGRDALSMGLYLIAAFYILMYLGAYLLVKSAMKPGI